ncbi:MAG: hypothetical protein JWO30_2463, partial [Fibrobacteres bacterium]|nr:hypothetical protein [Fibrobacterota bacterium]
MTGGGLGLGAESGMGFVGVRSCAPEIGTEKLGTGVFAVLWVCLGLFFWSGGWAEESDFNGAE